MFRHIGRLGAGRDFEPNQENCGDEGEDDRGPVFEYRVLLGVADEARRLADGGEESEEGEVDEGIGRRR